MASNPFDQFDSGNAFDQFDAKRGPRDPAVSARLREQDPATYDPNYQYGVQPTIRDRVGQASSAILRPMVQAIAAPGNLVADTAQSYGWLARKGIAGMTGGEQPQPPVLQSERFNQALDANTFAPQTGMGRFNEMTASVLLGSRIPMPQIGRRAPANFVAPQDDIGNATFQAGRQLGLSAQPASVNPTLAARSLETLGGKVATAQDASIQNMPVFTQLAKRSLGIADDAPLDLAALDKVRAAAGAPYQAIRGIGQIQATDKYRNALEAVAAPFRSAGSDFKSLAKSEVIDLVDDLNKPSFNSNSAVDAIALIRDNASKAYAGGDKTLGKAYREAAKALEDVIEDNLSAAGPGAKEVLRDFRAAREMIAKSYSVQGALNTATGNVSGTRLAQQLAKGKPLSGDMKTAAQFAQAFPKASREILDSGSVRNTDLIVGGGTAAITGQPWYLGYPLVRQAARNAALSPTYQDQLLKLGIEVPGWLFGATAPLAVSDR